MHAFDGIVGGGGFLASNNKPRHGPAGCQALCFRCSSCDEVVQRDSRSVHCVSLAITSKFSIGYAISLNGEGYWTRPAAMNPANSPIFDIAQATMLERGGIHVHGADRLFGVFINHINDINNYILYTVSGEASCKPYNASHRTNHSGAEKIPCWSGDIG